MGYKVTHISYTVYFEVLYTPSWNPTLAGTTYRGLIEGLSLLFRPPPPSPPRPPARVRPLRTPPSPSARVWDAGAIALAGALGKPSCHLEALGLSCTQLTDVAALAFSRAFIRGRSTEWSTGYPTDQSTDHSTERSTEQSTRSEYRPYSLRRLDLSRNGISDEGAR